MRSTRGAASVVKYGAGVYWHTVLATMFKTPHPKTDRNLEASCRNTA